MLKSAEAKIEVLTGGMSSLTRRVEHFNYEGTVLVVTPELRSDQNPSTEPYYINLASLIENAVEVYGFEKLAMLHPAQPLTTAIPGGIIAKGILG